MPVILEPLCVIFKVLTIEQRVQSREIVYLLSHEGRVQVRLRTGIGNKKGKYSPESVVSENSRTQTMEMSVDQFKEANQNFNYSNERTSLSWRNMSIRPFLAGG